MAPIPANYHYAGAEAKRVLLGSPATASRQSHSKVHRLLRWTVVAAILAQGLLVLYPDTASVLVGVVSHGCSKAAQHVRPSAHTPKALCPQEEALTPSHALYGRITEEIGSKTFRRRAIKWHSGAVQIPTESYDDMKDVGEDPRWDAFQPFHDYLLDMFPLVHSSLELTKINTYGLVYIWKGSDESLKPLLLMAHQDVVPVDPTTVDQWAHPPYSGHYDGERIWGRGSSDDKSGLIGIMITIETLLEKGFKPTRSIVLSFGFDEEASGVHGAQENAKALFAQYGKNAFALIVDEGGGFDELYGGIFAVPGIAEKGYLDVRVDVHTPGGHSSIPPPHTSIGMLAQMLVEYEANPYPASLQRSTPMFETIQCLASHAPGLPRKLRHAIQHSAKSDRALKTAEKELFKVPGFKALTGTTQAIDLVSGGVKSNALPEQAYAVVNHRIDTASSVGAVMRHDTKLLKPFAEKFNLSLVAFGALLTDADAPSYGTLELSDAWGTALEPAPITSTDAAPYKLLAGTIKEVYASHRGGEPDQEINVAPGIMSGNTDTQFYWKLSDHIFRYGHGNGIGNRDALGNIHTVNESIPVDAFLEMIRFFNTLILNVDEADF